MDGVDLKSDLTTAIQTTGQIGTGAYDVFVIDFSSALAQLGDGSATFSLTLAAPSGQFANSAGLGFATLFVVPEPSTALLLGCGLSRRQRAA